MITWIVEEKDVDVQYSLQDLMKFSKKNKAKVIVRGVLTLTNGVISYLS